MSIFIHSQVVYLVTVILENLFSKRLIFFPNSNRFRMRFTDIFTLEANGLIDD
jgi:hypothetical protein